MIEKHRLDDAAIAIRAAMEFKDGDVVNLGVGMPTNCVEYIPAHREVLLHTENGALGYGPYLEDPDITSIDYVNAGGGSISIKPGMSFMDHAESFDIIRGGHLDVAVLGAYQVSERGDIANWLNPAKTIGSVGGAMDLAVCTKRVIVTMLHTSRDGSPKIVKECSLPLTAVGAVDTIITDIAVITVEIQGLVLRELAPGWSAEDVQELTEPTLHISPELKEITLY